MGIIIFNGESSNDLKIHVEHPPEYSIPERDCTVTHVPGRNGDVVFDNGCWKNVSRSYQVMIDARRDQYSEVASGVAQWLHSTTGYARLEDSYEPDYYRIARYSSQINISNIMSQAGQATISFDCKPERYLKSGEEPIFVDGSTTIYNPTRFKSRPTIIIYGEGAGNIIINNQILMFLDTIDGLTMDSGIMDVYYENINCNAYAVIDEFPVLEPGENTITFDGGITRLEVIPRWWTL